MNRIPMFRSLAGVALFVGLSWGAGAQTPIRIVAANITAGNNQEMTAESTRILKATDPDIVLIQEFNISGTNSDTDIANYVNSTLGPGFFVFREPGNQSIPNGIISRYPLLETGEWNDSQVGDRDHAWARIDIPGTKDLWVVSVHLKASSASTQNAQAQEILAAMASKGIPTTDYVVIGGDFNTSSRSASCIGTFGNSAWSFATAGPYPVGEDGDGDTNRGRTSPYDWVLPNNVLDAIKTSTVYLPRVNLGSPNKIYANGLVFDTRDFTQSTLTEYFPPALVADSNATNMQHQAVVRTFLVPDGGGSTGPVNGTVATVGNLTSRAPFTVSVNTLMPAVSAQISVTANEFDLGSVSVSRLGTADDAGVPSVSLYRDNDNGGTVSAGDTLLGTATLSGGNATVNLSPAPRALPGSPIQLLAAVQVAAGATSGSTVGLRLNGNGMTASATGGSDPAPVFSAFSSTLAVISGDTPPPQPQGVASVVVNKFYNDGSVASGDALELLVVQDNLDLRGAIIKDYSSSMANDNGGKYVLSNSTVWTNLRSGTLIVLRNNTSAADVTTGGNDYNLDIGLANSTYGTLNTGAFDIAATEMVTVKGAGTGVAGTTGNIHSLAAGTAGSQYTNAPQPKVRATGTLPSAGFCYVPNTGTSGNSRLSNFSDTDGTAVTATSGLTLGSPNSAENTTFINFLRGPVFGTAVPGSTEGTIAVNWTALPTATGYRLDVSRSSDFSGFVAGYNGLLVGNVTSYVIEGLNDDDYYIRVRAENAEGLISGVRPGGTSRPAVAPPPGFVTEITNNFDTGSGWNPSGQVGALLTADIGSRSYDSVNSAITAVVGASPRARIIGWIESPDNDLPYSSVGADKFVRAKYSIYYSGTGDSANSSLANRVPNFRMSLRTRGAVNSVVEINHNAQTGGSPSQLNVTRELGPSKNPVAPSVYRVDFDPVDVPYLATATTEGVQRALETLVSGADYSFVAGTLSLTDCSIGTYPALDSAVAPVKVFDNAGASGSADFDNAAVTLSTLGFSAAEIFRYSAGPNASDYFNPAILNVSIPETGMVITKAPTGITVNSMALSTSRIGVADAAFTGGVFGDTPATRLRIEPDRIYALTFRLTHGGTSDSAPYTRVNMRTAGFGYNVTLDLLGGRGLPSADARQFLAQVMPGFGNQVPGTDANGSTYRLLFNSPLSGEIRADVTGTLAQKFPSLSTAPGPGDATVSSLRDVNLAFTVADSLSFASTTATDGAEAANNLVLNRMEIRSYPQIVD